MGMLSIDTASASRRAALTRLLLTAVLGFPIGFVGLLYAASGPVGLPFGAPSLYLIWVFGADLIAIIRGDSYRARRPYKWCLLAGSLVALMWIGYRVRSRFLKEAMAPGAEPAISEGG
jgi:membrane protein implicated in regulation of membrane protease activity